jgi:hypothetical protein
VSIPENSLEPAIGESLHVKYPRHFPRNMCMGMVLRKVFYNTSQSFPWEHAWWMHVGDGFIPHVLVVFLALLVFLASNY